MPNARGRITLKRLGIPKSVWARLFVIVALLEGYVIKRTVDIYQKSNESQWGFGVQDPTTSVSITKDSFIVYDVIFIVAQIFLLILCWEAVAHKNTIQIIAATIFNLMCLIYSLIQYTTFYIRPSVTARIFKNDNDMRILQITIMVVYSLCSLTFAMLNWELYQLFGWKTYKKLGANLRLRRAYKWHQILLTLLKLDIFFFISYSVQLATLVLNIRDPETWVQIGLVIPGSVLFLVMSFWALKIEHKRMMLGVTICLGLSPAYFIYKLIRMNVNIDSDKDPYRDTRKYLTFFIVVTMVLILITTYVRPIADYDARKAQLKANRAMFDGRDAEQAAVDDAYEYTEVRERFSLE
ncbi:hypothetical protein DL89DRAFT_264607 [Linderina pennispora]|uniref:Uncharacterized protein n=1 Tax=Linderina pennispora TaxID=61395 RepID=A0A1Y1WNL4_9FUNG|nr:uncharacterized protein DL89DRAFT_264607 [Linderina pennispora]ORX74816.1 hypothetical protein DL89DRAFT_264607 [Linderina pennispora]